MSAPSAPRHSPDACDTVRPWGKRGVTVVRRNSTHSSAVTTPVGLAVPKYSESWTANRSLLLQGSVGADAHAVSVAISPTKIPSPER